MLLRPIIVILFIFVFSSCDFISPKKKLPNNLALMDTIIDYNTVDVYPLLNNCNLCDSNDKQNKCFENELIKILKGSLKKENLKANNYLKDTIYVEILVDNLGKFSVYHMDEKKGLFNEIPKLDSVIKQSVKNLPQAIQPSLKRGIPVNVRFKLPILVSVIK